MNGAYLVNWQQHGKGAVGIFQGTDANGLGQAIAGFFAGQKYRLEQGTPVNGVYGTGSKAMRILFGGLAKRNKFNVMITPTPDDMTRLDVSKAMSGAMGGLVGYSRMNKEFQRVLGILHQFYSTHAPQPPQPR